jgi:hypothetical protein
MAYHFGNSALCFDAVSWKPWDSISLQTRDFPSPDHAGFGFVGFGKNKKAYSSPFEKE